MLVFLLGIFCYFLEPIKSISISKFEAGAYHNCIFTNINTTKCWGSNEFGALGLDYVNHQNDTGILIVDSKYDMGENLTYINFTDRFIPIAIALGFETTCAISRNNSVKCFGENLEGQLGNDYISNYILINHAKELIFDNAFTPLKFAFGKNHTCILSQQKTVRCFGLNIQGQLGYGDVTNRLDAINVSDIDLGAGFTPKEIYAGDDHVCVLSEEQSVKCWGKNNKYQLGYNHSNHIGDNLGEMGESLDILDFGDYIPAKLALGGEHSCAILNDGNITCWGYNNRGQLGIGVSDQEYRLSESRSRKVNLGEFYAENIVAGNRHTCAISIYKHIKCWGKNVNGQLGLGNTIDQNGSSVLDAVDLGDDFVVDKLVGGRDHSCAISVNDTIKCWGKNGGGQLGLGDNLDRGTASYQMGNNLTIVNIGPEFITTQSPTWTPTLVPSSNARNASLFLTILLVFCAILILGLTIKIIFAKNKNNNHFIVITFVIINQQHLIQ